MKSNAFHAPSVFAHSKLFLSAVILSVLAALLGISLADANAALATLQELPTRLVRDRTEGGASDSWIDHKVQPIVAKFRNSRRGGPSAFSAVVK